MDDLQFKASQLGVQILGELDGIKTLMVYGDFICEHDVEGQSTKNLRIEQKKAIALMRQEIDEGRAVGPFKDYLEMCIHFHNDYVDPPKLPLRERVTRFIRDFMEFG